MQDIDGYYYSKGLPKTHYKIQKVNLDSLNKIMEKFKHDHMEEIKAFMKEKRNYDNKSVIIDHVDLFIDIANKYRLKYQNLKSVTYFFQIYPKSVVNEGRGGVHYEFIAENDILFLDIHIESGAQVKDVKDFRKQMKQIAIEHGYNSTGSTRVVHIELADKNENEIENIFGEIYLIFEPVIERFYSQNQVKSNGDEMLQLKLSLNQILYGPPGTGKTYNTINKALEIILNEEPDEEIQKILEKANNDLIEEIERKKLLDKFNKYRDNGQIEFVTFHQSYGYEEFVEGIKANTIDSVIQYDIQPGIFKKLSHKANENLKISSGYNNEKINFEKLINDYGNYVDEQISQEKNISIENSSYKLIAVRKDSKDDIKTFIVGKDSNSQSLAKKILMRDIEAFFNNEIKNYTDIKHTYDSVSSYHGNALYYYEILRFIKEFYDAHKELYRIKDLSLKNYILIIDEINRGNISKIFGELITLIESSKRILATEELRIKLPYSGDDEEPFGVPKNLYIIGTMNTADRSIAPIDTALRRRFEFIEIPPKPEKLNENIEGINLQELLVAINTRIEYIYDRDHTIGHSYLLNIESLTDLKLAFKNSILPLLAEYFYEDWKNIKIVLNEEKIDGFIQSKKNNQYLPTNRNGKVLYEFKDIDDLTENDFKRIYDEQEPTP
jgi:5-methylcytosine-specific restriction protein B